MINQIRYTGIGSRNTPISIKQTVVDIAIYLAQEHSAILVSGGARGADSFFEEGADRGVGPKEIWLPELGFNKSKSKLLPSKNAFIVAQRYVDHWKSCGEFARNAHARNCHQILGADLVTPVSFVICWTPGAMKVGGTATALSIAEDHGIPILNLADEKIGIDDISFFIEVNAGWPH